MILRSKVAASFTSLGPEYTAYRCKLAYQRDPNPQKEGNALTRRCKLEVVGSNPGKVFPQKYP